MSQHDMDIANAVGATVRADINSALLALVGNNSGATEPATMYAYMLWYDTANGIIKQRNSANTAWGGVDVAPATTATQAVRLDQMPQSPLRNRFGNGDYSVSQINGSASVTITAAAALNYVIDQWYAYCTGANVTGQRIAGSGQDQFRYQFTGAASVTAIGFAQRIEQNACYDMNGQSTMISVDMSNSLLTSVTYTVNYANTADTFGTLASPTVTQIATGTITVSSTLTRFYIPVSVPSAATTGIEIKFSVGAQTSGTWIIGKAQFEVVSTGATTATAFEVLPYETQLRRAQRYLPSIPATIGLGIAYGTNILYGGGLVALPVTARVAPTGVLGGAFSVSGGSAGTVGLRYASVQNVSLFNSANNWTAGSDVSLTTAAFLTGAQL